MRVLKKILVPVDFSPASAQALAQAMTLAEPFSGSLHVLHTWEVPTYLRPDLTVWSGDVSATLADHAKREAEKNMHRFLEDARLLESPHVTSEVLWGAPYPTILAVAEEGGYDLIAMGTHGRTGLAHLVMGSVAEKVVRHAKCPVLTVRVPEAA
jgi:universal stress protein A